MIAGALPASAGAEQASAPLAAAAAQLDVGAHHTCALLGDGSVRCWGFGLDGRLGYANTSPVGDDETPASVGPVNLGRRATAISAGAHHTCALLDDASVRCWGFGLDGRLGYANTSPVGDDETPGSVGPVNLGRGADAISAGAYHTCALLDDGAVRCWGWAGRLGRVPAPGSANDIGDNEPPAAIDPVALGNGRRATAISAGGYHTCALLDDGAVRCWSERIPTEDLRLSRPAVAISAADNHTCALLDDATVRCWHDGGDGRLGYATSSTSTNVTSRRRRP